MIPMLDRALTTARQAACEFGRYIDRQSIYAISYPIVNMTKHVLYSNQPHSTLYSFPGVAFDVIRR